MALPEHLKIKLDAVRKREQERLATRDKVAMKKAEKVFGPVAPDTSRKDYLLAKLRESQKKRANPSASDFTFDPDALLQCIAEAKAELDADNMEVRKKLALRKKIRELQSLQIDPSKLSSEEILHLKEIAPTVFENVEVKDANNPGTTDNPAPVNDGTSGNSSDLATEKRAGESESQQEKTRGKSDINYEDLNEEQKQAVTYSVDGISFCLIGSAGSGKTTTQKMVLEKSESTISFLEETHDHNYLSVLSPSVAIVSFTNKAVENIRSAAPERFKNSCMTIHKLLQYSPVEELKETYDEYGNEITVPVMVFRPMFTAENKLPHLELIIVEESSNISTELYDQVVEALPHPDKTRWIFLGDLNQLPPVVGNPVLADKMLELPVVALEKVYRQNSDSAIKKFAMDILEGRPLNNKQVLDRKVKGQFEPYIFPKRVDSAKLLPSIAATIRKMIELGRYVAGEDVILLPNNANGPKINMVNVNLEVAEIYRQIDNREIWEIQAGFEKRYYAIDDIVFYKKQYHKITGISANPKYKGIPTRAPSTNMDRWGAVIDPNASGGEQVSVADLMSLPTGVNLEHLHTKEVDGEENEKTNQLSHLITVVPMEGEYFQEEEISDMGKMKDFQFGYALTVHKSQGSEWRNVLMILHHEAIRMARRELLYTGVTRPRECLFLWFDGEERGNWGGSWLQKGIVNQEIPGKTVEDKLEYFRMKKASKESAKMWKEKLRRKANRDADRELYGEKDG